MRSQDPSQRNGTNRKWTHVFGCQAGQKDSTCLLEACVSTYIDMPAIADRLLRGSGSGSQHSGRRLLSLQQKAHDLRHRSWKAQGCPSSEVSCSIAICASIALLG